MNYKEFIQKYEELLNSGYCECNELNCLDNNPPKKILNIMKEQQQEIERLNNKHNKALEKINDYKIYCKKNKGFTEYTDIEIEAIEPVISKLEDILKEEK